MSSIQTESFVKYLQESWKAFSENPVVNPLYVVPVVSVLALCLFVYAIGVRSSPVVPPPAALALLRDDYKSKKTQQSSKKNNNQKSQSSTKSKPVDKRNENGHIVNNSLNKPKAVVKPLKPEKQKSTPLTHEAVKKQKPAPEEIEDFTSGQWITVVKKKPQKPKETTPTTIPVTNEKEVEKPKDVIAPVTFEASKPTSNKKDKKLGKKEKGEKKAKSNDKSNKLTPNEPIEQPATVVTTPTTDKQPPVVEVVEKPPSPGLPPPIPVLDWTAEEPEEYRKEDSSKAQRRKSRGSSAKEVKKLESQSQESVVLPPPQPQPQLSTVVITSDDKPTPKDKITDEIIAQYDSVPAPSKKEARKTNNNKKTDNNKSTSNKDQTSNNKLNRSNKPKDNSQGSVLSTPAPAASKDKQQEDKKKKQTTNNNNKKKSTANKIEPQTMSSLTSPPTASVSNEVVPEVKPDQPPPSSEMSSKSKTSSGGSTDITDTTESDPSEGEFKVVRKRKARRE